MTAAAAAVQQAQWERTCSWKQTECFPELQLALLSSVLVCNIDWIGLFSCSMLTNPNQCNPIQCNAELGWFQRVVDVSELTMLYTKARRFPPTFLLEGIAFDSALGSQLFRLLDCIGLDWIYLGLCDRFLFCLCFVDTGNFIRLVPETGISVSGGTTISGGAVSLPSYVAQTSASRPDFTLSFWFYLTSQFHSNSADKCHTLVGKGCGEFGTFAPVCQLREDMKIRVLIATDHTEVVCCENCNVSAGRWTHVAVVLQYLSVCSFALHSIPFQSRLRIVLSNPIQSNTIRFLAKEIVMCCAVWWMERSLNMQLANPA